jgi:hypothetical protein
MILHCGMPFVNVLHDHFSGYPPLALGPLSRAWHPIHKDGVPDLRTR